MHALSQSCVMLFLIRLNICLTVHACVLVKAAFASNKIRLNAKIWLAALL